MKTASFDDLATYCGVPESQVQLFPPAFGFAVMVRLAEFRGVADNDYEEWDRLYAVLDTWREHLSSTGTRYRVSPAGLERDFAAWLASHLEVLQPDYPIQLVKGEHVFGNRRRADFLCEFTGARDGARPGDLLVIENKAVPIGIEALIQLQDYLRLAREELAEPEQEVFGLLICDGTNVELRQALQQVTDIGYATLSELGYRDHLYRTRGYRREVEQDEVASDPVQLTSTPVPREATSGSELTRAVRNGSRTSSPGNAANSI